MKDTVRKFVLARDKVCQKCGTGGSKRNPLTIHHIMPQAKYRHLINDPDNCRVLCRNCHDKVHGINRRKNRRKSRTEAYWREQMEG